MATDNFDVVTIHAGGYVPIHYKEYIVGPAGGTTKDPIRTDETVWVKPPTVAERQKFQEEWIKIGINRLGPSADNRSAIRARNERTELVAKWVFDNMIRQDQDASWELVLRERIGVSTTRLPHVRAPGSGGLDRFATHALAFEILKLMGIKYERHTDLTYDEIDTASDDNIFRLAAHTGQTLDELLKLQTPVYDAWIRFLDRHKILIPPPEDTAPAAPTPLTIGTDDGQSG